MGAVTQRCAKNWQPKKNPLLKNSVRDDYYLTFVEFFLQEENSNSPSTCDGVTWVDCVAIITTAYHTGGKTKGGEWTNQMMMLMWGIANIAYHKNHPRTRAACNMELHTSISGCFPGLSQRTTDDCSYRSLQELALGLFIWLWIGKRGARSCFGQPDT